ncbi:proprotein convertase P-domain-containing protein [Novipirellula artificiosorum]|nr:proprotein convertase P-domain-containing protein [Novipirellula artificiosorum]
MGVPFKFAVLPLLLLGVSGWCSNCFGQSGLRDSLERLDRNGNGEIDPAEITPLARPYLERIAKSRRLSLDRPNGIDKWQEAARIYHAFQNGVVGKKIVPEDNRSVMPFGPDPDQPLVPEFGLPEVKYPYIQDDLDEADQTIRRHDRNRDGYIDRSEARRATWTHRDPFDEDIDQDDRLSRLELAQRYARRRLLSGDSDELIQKARRTGNGIEPSKPAERQGRDDSQWWRGGSRYYLTATILGRFDSNKNGRLDANEAARIGIPMGRMDVDRDGELSRDELTTFLLEMQDEAGETAEGLPAWFYERDANRDEQVAMAEFTDEWTADQVEEFASLDTNRDGLLTVSEVIQSKAMVGGSYVNNNAEVLPPKKAVLSEIVVDEDYLIGDLNITLSISHTSTGQLDAFLTGPDGQRIELFTEVGGHDDHFDQTVFDDQGRYPITKARPPFKGTFLPEGLLKRQPSLGHFNGQSIKGVWQLTISATRSDRFGMLHNWGLIVKPQEQMPGDSTSADSTSAAENANRGTPAIRER